MVKNPGNTHVKDRQLVPLVEADCCSDSTSYQSTNSQNNSINTFSRRVGFVGNPRFLIFSYQLGTLEFPDLGFWDLTFESVSYLAVWNRSD
jgi:hypothetical protein